MPPFMQLLGTVLPVLGVVVTLLQARRMTAATARAFVLLAGPAVTLAVSSYFADVLGANGNMLFVALLLLLWLFLFVYYPVLIGVWIVRTFRRRRTGPT